VPKSKVRENSLDPLRAFFLSANGGRALEKLNWLGEHVSESGKHAPLPGRLGWEPNL